MAVTSAYKWNDDVQPDYISSNGTFVEPGGSPDNLPGHGQNVRRNTVVLVNRWRLLRPTRSFRIGINFLLLRYDRVKLHVPSQASRFTRLALHKNRMGIKNRRQLLRQEAHKLLLRKVRLQRSRSLTSVTISLWDSVGLWYLQEINSRNISSYWWRSKQCDITSLQQAKMVSKTTSQLD
jgi:hypothetical protein